MSAISKWPRMLDSVLMRKISSLNLVKESLIYLKKADEWSLRPDGL